MKKFIDGLKIGAGFFTFVIAFFVIGYWTVNARNGLQSNPGDKLTSTAWNNLVNDLNVLSGQVNSSVSRTSVASQGNWTSALSCRRVGNFLEFNGYIVNSTASSFRGATGFYVPAACRPSYTIIYPSAACWNGGYNTGRCFFSLDSNGQINFYTQDTMGAFSFAGVYSAN